MLRSGKRAVDYAYFIGTGRTMGCRSLSRLERPRDGEICWAYVTTVAELLAAETFLVCYTRANSDEFTSWDSPDAIPVKLREAIAGPLAESILRGWSGEGAKWDREAPYLALHCKGCDRLVIIDGVHRLTWLASRGESGQRVNVVELSGSAWRENAPDMSVICACREQSRVDAGVVKSL